LETNELNTFHTDITGSSFMDMLTWAGYGVGRGSSTAGLTQNISLPAFVNDYSGSSSVASWLQNDIQGLINSGAVRSPDANNVYMVYLPPGVNIQAPFGKLSNDATNGFAGYHWDFHGRDAVGKPIDIHYAVIVSATSGPNFADITLTASHELAEAV